MEKKIQYKDLSCGPVSECRDLCNDLLKYQAEKAVKLKEVLASMNFENRLVASFNASTEKFLLVAYDNALPVAYIYCTAELITEVDKNQHPTWAKSLPVNTEGLYPKNLKTPAKIATLNNLYVRPEYQGYHIGKHLMKAGMQWLHQVPNTDEIFVYVSNGNNVAPLYEKYGFIHSHSVYDGFIEAYVIPK